MKWNSEFGPFAMAICIVVDTYIGLGLIVFGVIELFSSNFDSAFTLTMLGIIALLNIYTFFSLAQDDDNVSKKVDKIVRVIPLCSECNEVAWRGKYCRKHWQEKWPDSYKAIYDIETKTIQFNKEN